MFDIAICGAGPTGAVLAYLLGRTGRLRVALIDRRRLDAPPQSPGPFKTCGGLLAPDAQRSLSSLGLLLPKAILCDPQLFSVRTIDLKAGLERCYQRFYMNLDREFFDRWLVSLSEGMVTRFFGQSLRRIDRTPGGVRLTVGVQEVEARLLVGCDGGGSLVRRQCFPQLSCRRYASVQETFPVSAAALSPLYCCFFHHEITDYYAWALPKDGRYLLGAAIPEGSDVSAKFARLKELTVPYGFDFSAPTGRGGAILLRPSGVPRTPASPDGHLYLAGEAGGFISPSSAEGISFALDSAIALYQSILSGGEDPAGIRRAYRAHSRALRAKVLGKQCKAPFLYQPLLRGLVMRSGMQSHDRIP